MTYAELADHMADLARSIGAEGNYVYYQYPVGLAPEPPYLIYYISSRDDFRADNSNYVKLGNLIVELYTNKKDPVMESLAEAWFESQEYAPDIEEQYIDSESMHEVIYSMEVVIDG